MRMDRMISIEPQSAKQMGLCPHIGTGIEGGAGNDTLQGNVWNKLRWHEAANDAPRYEIERRVA